jgi:hypothetical protein
VVKTLIPESNGKLPFPTLVRFNILAKKIRTVHTMPKARIIFAIAQIIEFITSPIASPSPQG